MHIFFRTATLLFGILGALFLLSCGDDGSKKVTSNLFELFGREVVVDSTLGGFAWNRSSRTLLDTCFAPLSDHNALKVVAYYNAKGCTACRLKELHSWHQWQQEADSIGKLVNAQMHLVLLFGPGSDRTKLHEIETALIQNRIDFPILIDTTGVFEVVNLLPTEEQYHYFLLDKQNKILVVGSPINNPKIKTLYLNQIIEATLKKRVE